MIVQALDGRHITVQRRWLPWNLRKREFDTDVGDAFGAVEFDSIEGFAFGLVAAIVWVLIGGLILSLVFLFGEALLLLLLLLPLLAAARMFWILPWIIEATYGDQELGNVGVRGWRDSQERIREIAAAYQRGEDPFSSRGPG